MNAFQRLVRLLRVLRDTRTKEERIQALRGIAALADDLAGEEERRTRPK